MASVTFEWDRSHLTGFKKSDAALFRALKRAGSEAAKAMRAEASRHIRERKRFKVKDVNRGLPLLTPRGNTIESLVWTMRASGKPVPLATFPARQTRKGVSVEVNRGQRKLVKSAFLATMKSGHTGVFVRQGKARLPIRELYTSKISDVLQDTGAAESALGAAQRRFSSAFGYFLEREMKR
jgi:hypothetical protein